MKIGDKVRVVALEDVDILETNLAIGAEGIIISEGSDNDGCSDDVFGVNFGKSFEVKEKVKISNYNHENCAYDMWYGQLEKI